MYMEAEKKSYSHIILSNGIDSSDEEMRTAVSNGIKNKGEYIWRYTVIEEW